MDRDDLRRIEETAKRYLVVPNDEDGKTLAAFVLNHLRAVCEENDRFRSRIDTFERDRPTSPDLEIVEDPSVPPCRRCGGRVFRSGACVTCGS